MVKLSSNLLFKLKTYTFNSWIKTKFLKKKIQASRNSEASFDKLFLGYAPNLENPFSLNEKRIWLKLNYTNHLWRTCAGKLKVKDFRVKQGLSGYAVKTLGGPYKNSREIDLNSLPEKFVLKTNHDSGTVFVCEKGKISFHDVFKKLDESVSSKYLGSGDNHEWVYDQIEPLIFAEEFLEPSEGNDLCDFKFFCFNGVPQFLYVIFNRPKDERIKPWITRTYSAFT